ATTLGLAWRVHPRQIAAQLLVGRELVEQAALEPAAVAEQPVVGQRHVLRLGHLHRDRLELSQIRRAAELPAPPPHAVEHPGGVAGADLSHLDARAELAREIAHELAEIDALLAAEVHSHPALPGRHLDVHDLHDQIARARQPLAGEDGRLLPTPLLAVIARLLVGGEADHAVVEPVTPELGHRPARAPDLAERGAALRLDADDVADVQDEIADQLVIVGGGTVAQPHAHEVFAHGFEIGHAALRATRAISVSTVSRGVTLL